LKAKELVKRISGERTFWIDEIARYLPTMFKEQGISMKTK
jgi:hypothetical protein